MQRRGLIVLLAGVAAWSLAARAQGLPAGYPDHPITLIVPYAAGGGNDVLARAVADPMARLLGQPVVVENRGGAGGSVGTRQVAKAPPDGYTLGLGGTGTLAIDPTLYPNAGYDPRKDFAPVGMIAMHVQIYFSSLPPAVGLVKDGKLRALGVTSLKRSVSFPDVPTVAEQGLPGFEAVLHYGIVAPAGTPRPIIDKLNAVLRAALADPKVHGHIATEGAEPLPSSPDEYAADIDREEIKWSALVKKSGATAK